MNAPTDIPTDESGLRVPPHSVEAEQSVLGGLLIDNSAWDKAADLLTDSDFYRYEHKLIFAAVGRLVNAGKPADVVTVFEELTSIGKAEGGGLSYLNALAQSVPSAANLRRYSEIVREYSLHRRLIALVDAAAATAWAPGLPMSDRLDRIAASVSALERGTQRRQPKALADLIVERIDHVNAVAEGNAADLGWSTRCGPLDEMLNGGLRPGHVYVIAARPAVGKSSFSQQLALVLAEQGLPTLYLSQEMPGSEVADRALANLGRIGFGKIQTAQLSDGEWSSLSEAVDRGARLPLFVDDQAALSIGDIRAKARSVKGLRVLVLDYLQLCAGSGDNRNAEIETLSRGLKALAKEMGIAIVSLSQLNRAVESRNGQRPRLSDLRDSGAVEQDADVVAFLWRVRTAGERQIIGLAVEKNRQGRCGAFGLDFDGDVQRWAVSTADISEDAGKVKGTYKSKGGFE
ncbi:MAG: replicative DNA helicase [Paucibacter sp.]|nr:replicative DNA helicase [Roseateles sp.]